MGTDDARAHDGRTAAWPARPDDLLRTDLCPACFAPLDTLLCARCGLDVRAPQAAQVLAASQDVARLMDDRGRLIGSMREWAAARERAAAETAAALARTLRPAGPASSAEGAAGAPARIAGTWAAPAAAPLASGRPTAPGPEVPPGPVLAPGAPVDRPRRRLSVPAVLLAVGVVLLSVAAVFYVVYAFVTYGLVVRAAITAAVTLAALTATGILARRRLPGTAEAIGAVGVVLLHLDVWAVRAYDLAGAGSADPFAYSGAGTLVASVVLLALRPLLRVRSVGLAGWAGLPVAAGLLVAAVPDLDAGTRTAFALAAASAVALLHALPRWGGRMAPDVRERTALRVVGVTASAGALVAGAASAVDPAATPAIPLLVAAVAGGAHAWVLSGGVSRIHGSPDADASRAAESASLPEAPALRFVAALASGAAAALALPMTALTGGGSLLTLCGQLLAAAAAAALLDVARHRLRVPGRAASARIARDAAAVVTVGAATPPVLAALGGLIGVVVAGVPPWTLDPTDEAARGLVLQARVVDPVGDVRMAVLGLVGAWAVAVAASVVGRTAVGRLVPLAWSGAAVVVVGIPALGSLALVVSAYVLVAVGSAVIRIRASRSHADLTHPDDRDGEPRPGGASRSDPEGLPAVPVVVLGISAALIGWAASWASAPTWWAATPVLLALLALVARRARSDDTARAATAGTVLGILLSAAALAPSLRDTGLIGPAPASASLGEAADPVLLVLIAAALVLVVAGASRGAPGIRRRAALATALLPALVASVVVAAVGAVHSGGSLTRAPAWAVGAQAVLVIGVVAWTVGGRGRLPLPERVARSAAPASAAPAPRPVGARSWRLLCAALVAPVLLLAALTVARLVPTRDVVHGVVPAGAALAVALLGLLAYRRRSPALRTGLDVGALAIGGCSLVAAVVGGTFDGGLDRLWIPLLVLALATLAMAPAVDGLLLSRSRRRAWAWTGFALGVLALWSGLSTAGIRLPEAHVLPVAGTLLVVAALVHHAALRASAAGGSPDADGDTSPHRPDPGPRVRKGVTALALAGILTAVLLLAPAGQPDDVIRPLVLTVACAALALLAATALRRAPSPVRPLLRVAVIGGGVGLLAVGATRAVRLALHALDRAPAVDLQLVVTCVLLVVLGALVLRAARDADDAWIAGVALGAVPVLTAVVMVLSVRPAQGVVRPLVAAVLLVAAAGLVLGVRTVHRRVLDGVASVALLSVVVVALSAWRGAAVTEDVEASAVPVIAAVLIASLGAVERLRGRIGATTTGAGSGLSPHRAADAASAVLVLVSVVAAATTDAAGLPLALLLGAVAVLLGSLAPTRGRRQQLGWAALGLGSAALWVALARGDVEDVEPYVLPPAGVLLLLAAAFEHGLPEPLRRMRVFRADSRRRGGGAPLVLASLLLAAVPSAVASWSGDPVRALVLGGAAGAALLLAASALRAGADGPSAEPLASGARAQAPVPARPLLLAVAGPAALAVLLVGIGRPLALLMDDPSPTFARTDLWSLTSGAVLILAVALHAAPSPSPSPWPTSSTAPETGRRPAGATGLARAEAVLPRVVALAALGGTAVVGTCAVVLAEAHGLPAVSLRSAALVTLLALLHVLASSSGRPVLDGRGPGAGRDPGDLPGAAAPMPAGPPQPAHQDAAAIARRAGAGSLRDGPVSVAALVVAALVAVVLAVAGAADPVECVTLPVAAALLVVGARRLVHDARAGSMRHLAPGLLVLLVPPLLADVGPNEPWRIVGLGVVALAVLLVGAARRLRAPFLIGAGVLLVHAVAQLWPWIRDASATVPWWAWAGIGGVVLIAVAARYERRIRDLREVAARVSALR